MIWGGDWIFRVWSLLFSDGWSLWKSIDGMESVGDICRALSLHRSPSVYIPIESLLAVRIMWILITTWSACCDSFITVWIMSFITRVISLTFYNSLHWNRSCCNVWNMRWPGGATDSMNVDGYQRSWLLRSSCSGWKLLISGWWYSQWILQKEKCHRGRRFLRRRREDWGFKGGVMIEVLPAHRKYRILELKNRMCKYSILPL